MYLKLTAAWVRGLSFPVRAHLSLSLSVSLSLSLSLSVSSAQSVRRPLYICDWKELKHRYIASLILHAIIAEIIAQLLSLSYVLPIWFYRTMARLGYKSGFLCRLTFRKEELKCSLNGSRFSHYFIFIPLSDNRNNKIYQWKQFYWEFSCIKIGYSMWHWEANKCNNK